MREIFMKRKHACLIFAALAAACSGGGGKEDADGDMAESPDAVDAAEDAPEDVAVDGDAVDGRPEDATAEDAAEEDTGPPPETCRRADLSEDTPNSDPVVFWPKPLRAHPGVPFAFTMVAYDPEKDELSYALEGAPDGMAVAADGTLTWSPTDAHAAASPYGFTVRIEDSRGAAVTVPVSLAVSRDGFVFVATDGSDTAGDGSLDLPCGTIEHGMEVLAGLPGGTLLIRGGTYNVNWEWERDGVPSPLRGARFTADAAAEIRSYPGESVLINCESGHGIWAYATSYVLMAGLEIRNASSGERGGAIAHGDHIVFQDVVVHDSNWSASSNCTGFLLNGEEVVAHRCTAYDNYDRTSDHWNSSNYLVYTEDAGSSIFIIDSVSRGSITGYKIKHAGPGTLLVHDCLEEGSAIGLGAADDGSAVRYSTFVGNDTAIHLGMTDPSAWTTGGMTVEYNTVVDAQGMAIVVQGGYLADDLLVRHNIVKTDVELGATEDMPHMYFLWPYEDDTSAFGMLADMNCFFAPNDDRGFRLGPGESVSFASWQATGRDGGSVWGDPMFVGTGDFRLDPASACLGPGRQIGAWPCR
jgi:hypothetical protein